MEGCSSRDAIRPDPLSCCKVCPKKEEKIVEKSEKPYPVITNTDSQELNDMGSERSGLDILASGGCALKGNYHENGVGHQHDIDMPINYWLITLGTLAPSCKTLG